MKFLSLLSLMFAVSVAHAQGPKLGSDADPVRQLLYVAHPVREMLKSVKTDGASVPLKTIVEASQLADSGKKAEAIARYRQALTEASGDARFTLWIWTGLRSLGQNPEPAVAHQVLGVVIEVPNQTGYDTLAAYTDSTARYLNFNGGGIFWDVPDAKIKALIQTFVDASIPAASKAQPRTTLALPAKGAQVTLLTRAGPYVITQPPAPVINAGAALMMELTLRNQAAAQQKK